jgi:phosphoribosylamine--glycine ligase
LPVLFDPPLDADDDCHIHYGEVGLVDSALATSGLYGWTMVVTGTAPTVAQAREAAYRRVNKVVVPNGRYRLDIGERLIARDYQRVERLGLLDPAGPGAMVCPDQSTAQRD